MSATLEVQLIAAGDIRYHVAEGDKPFPYWGCVYNQGGIA